MSHHRPALTVLAAALGFGGCGGGSGDSGGVVMSPCGFDEPASNHAFASAAAHELGAQQMGCLTAGDAGGADFYVFDAPGDAGGGYVKFQIDAAGAGKLRAIVYGAKADAELGRAAAPDAATPLTLFVAVAPGATYRIAVEDDGGFTAPYAYALTSAYTAVPDTFEPNDTVATAAPIAPGAPVDAFLFAGAAMPSDPATALDDHYRVTATAGQTISVTLTNLATNVAARLFVYGPDGLEVARVATGHFGESLSMKTPFPAAGGDHVVRVALWSAPPAPVTAGDTPPASYTQPYRLTVTQP